MPGPVTTCDVDDATGPASRDYLEPIVEIARTRLRHRYSNAPDDQIEDAVADAVAQWLERYEALAPRESAQRLIQRLAEWRLLDRMSTSRRQIAVAPADLERLDDSRANVENKVLGREASRFAQSIYLLTQRSRRVLSLWSKGYDMREISMRLHLKMFTVRKKKERALRKLRALLSRSRPRV